MSKSEQYRARLAALDDWDAYLLKESGLPGPRANLELVQLAADMGTPEQFKRWVAIKPTSTAEPALEYLPLCGAVGLGHLVAERTRASARSSQLKTLRRLSSDPRWRVREGVVMGLQQWGDRDMPALVDEMEDWGKGNLYEQRAAVAVTCEPRLLKDKAQVKRVLKLLDTVTQALIQETDRKSDPFRTLKKGLAYCWSVAVAASPTDGKRAMEKWLRTDDPDVRAIMRDNLGKDRLRRMDPDWVKQWETKLKA